MNFNINTTKIIILDNFYFPFTVNFSICRGYVFIKRKNYVPERSYDFDLTIERQQQVDIQILPDSSGAASLVIELHDERPTVAADYLLHRLRNAMQRRASQRVLSRELAAAIFCDPNGDWSIDRVASLAGTTRRKFQLRLLSESQCLTAIVSQQVRQRGLLDSLAGAINDKNTA
jgi:hypothetical protein